MKNIVACVDLSENTSAVVEAALTFANVFKTKLFIINAAVLDAGTIAYDGMIIPELQETRKAVARKALNQLLDPLVENGVDVTTILLEDSGNVVYALLNEAHRLEAGLIVAGSHGHGAFYSIVLGSTSEGLVRHAKCPVLIIPPQRAPEHEPASFRTSAVSK